MILFPKFYLLPRKPIPSAGFLLSVFIPCPVLSPKPIQRALLGLISLETRWLSSHFLQAFSLFIIPNSKDIFQGKDGTDFKTEGVRWRWEQTMGRPAPWSQSCALGFRRAREGKVGPCHKKARGKSMDPINNASQLCVLFSSLGRKRGIHREQDGYELEKS